ncbi:chorismate-binding protein, partial [Staphylococcus saprophyticus]|uniref:chorismate-binding protein n=1 Tax=Staphylococcus saprophyticus TaxID=29385 RepID=UPI00370479D9
MNPIPETASLNLYKPFHIQTYTTLFQITSMLTTQLTSNTDLIHLLTPLFPSPSITPPPKFNTIQYIKHLQHT